MSQVIRTALGVMALAGLPAVAAAQSNSAHFNIAAGVTLPSGDYGTRYDAGYNIIAGIGFSQRTSPLGFRVEGTYNEFNAKCGNNPGNCSDNAHAGGVTGNIQYDLLQPNRAQSNTFYVIGGVGYYSTREAFSTNSRSDVGFNVGAGLKFPLSGFSPYIEARYHSIQNVSATFFPISFGLVF